MNEKTEVIVNYQKICRIVLKSGVILKSQRDPSVDMEREISNFINEQKSSFNSKVSENFDIESESYQKFEFFAIDKRAARVTDLGDKVDGMPVAFRSKAQITLLYLKPRSLVLFQTNFDFAVTHPGCGKKGTLYQSGGRNYELEEVYFNKISTVGAQHEEVVKRVLNEGCGGGTEATFTETYDGFVIRAGENFRVFASDKNMQELRDARKLINDKISNTN